MDGGTGHLGLTGTVVFPRIFTAEECREIVAMAERHGLDQGMTHNGHEYVVDQNKRRVQTAYMAPAQQNTWIYRRMENFFAEAADRLGIGISSVEENLKVMKYGAGDHFGAWHMDVGNAYAAARKISMSIELSQPTEFSGGELEIFPEPNASLKVPQGGGVAFPSFRYHRVTPVTRGTRYSLVNWISGPAY